MSYTVHNFKTKKALKEAVKNYFDKAGNGGLVAVGGVRCYNPGLGPDLSNWSGSVYLEGPHSPARHTWYAEGVMKNGILIKVK